MRRNPWRGTNDGCEAFCWRYSHEPYFGFVLIKEERRKTKTKTKNKKQKTKNKKQKTKQINEKIK